MFPLFWFEVIIERRLVQEIAPMAHRGETSMMRWFSPEETESAPHSHGSHALYLLPHPLVFSSLFSSFFFYQSNEINNNGDTGWNGKLDNIVVQRSSASRFCAECRSHIRRGRRQPRYAERMPAIVAPSTAGGASVVGARVAHRLPPPRHPTATISALVPSLPRLPLALVTSFLRHPPTALIDLPSSLPPYPRTTPCTLRSYPHPLSFSLSLSRQPPPAAVSIGPVVPRQSAAVAPTSERGPPPPSLPS